MLRDQKSGGHHKRYGTCAGGRRICRLRTMPYVLSNQKNFYGAAGVLNDSILAEFAERIQKNLYLLPASIHEFIIVPDEGKTNVEELNEMAREINEFVAGTQEVLEDHVYYYDRKKQQIMISE